MVIADILIALVISPITAGATVLFTQTAINELAAGSSFYIIIKAVIVYEIIITAAILIQVSYHICYRDKREKRLQILINRSIYEQVLKTDFVYFDNAEFFNSYTFAINELVVKSAEAMNLIINSVSSLSTLIVMVGLMLKVGPLSILIVFISIITGILIGVKQNKLSIKKHLKMIPLDRKLSYIHRIFYLNDFAADLRSTKIERFFMRDYDETGKNEIDIIAKFATYFIGWSLFDNTFTRACSFGIVMYIIYNIVNGKISGIGAFTGQIYAANQLSSSLSIIIGLVNRVNALSMYANQIRAFYELESRIECTQKHVTEAATVPVPNGAYTLDIRNISFSYPNSAFSIRKLSLRAKAGEKIAIVGENGAGKSTLMKLLLRLYDVDSGEVEINGKALREYNIHELRGRIGIAIQKPAIYSLSMRENIEAYNEASEIKIKEIIKLTGLDEVLEKNNADIDTLLTKEFDTEGVVLSGGEAQKLAIARVLCGDFGLLC